MMTVGTPQEVAVSPADGRYATPGWNLYYIPPDEFVAGQP
jgi:hypothetical protein